jgi:glucose/mannose-6-phosphate isomerase
MIAFSDIKKNDTNSMYKTYDNWPNIARDAYSTNLNQVTFEKTDHIVFGGMGGSGAIGDIFSAILSKTNIHVDVVKGYLLPKTVDSKSIVVITSTSGNTEEAISVLKSAIDLGCNIIAFSDGGKIKKICNENNIEYREISMIHSPRASFTKFLYSMLKILEPIIPIAENDIHESIDELENLRVKISSKNLNEQNPALSLAYWITKIPVIYFPWGLQASAIRFKNSLQENAKIHAISEDVIEASHNGIVPWEKITNLKPILLQGKDDYVKTKERWIILKEFFEENKIEYKEIVSVEGSILSKIINLIYLLDYTSIYKAVISNVDPTPVTPIKYIKNKL